MIQTFRQNMQFKIPGVMEKTPLPGQHQEIMSDRLKGLSPDEVLQRFSPDEVLQRFTPEEIQLYLKKLGKKKEK
jgi:hypothetical protein